MIRLILSGAALLWMVGCGGFPFFRKAKAGSEEKTSDCGGSSVPGTASRGRAALELRDVRYNGDSLEGLLLIGAEGGSLCLDKTRLSITHVHVDWVWDCTTAISNHVPHMVVDYYSKPRRKEDLVILEPGCWFGGPVSIPLFVTEQPGGRPNPDCVEVSLSLLPLEGGPAGRIKVRAQRAPPAEGGAPQGPQPSQDEVD